MDPNSKAIRLLRAAFIAGAVIDGVWVVPMLIPEIGLPLYGMSGSGLTPPLRYALQVGAALMAGWTALLAWAAVKPLERRAVALMTLLPVKVGLDAAGLYLALSGTTPIGRALLMKIDALPLYALFIAALTHSSPKRIAAAKEAGVKA